MVWVNNLRKVTRPQLFLELAVMLADYTFTMIGGPVPGHESYYGEILNRAKTVRKLEFLGAVPYREANDYFACAKVL